MPRTREQQDAHNERRRIVKREGRKAIACMKYIKAKYPDIHQEACGFFDMVNERYPGKRDLSTTYEFKHIKNPRMLEVQLEIPLIPSNLDNTNTVTTTEEIPLINFDSLENEEIQKIITELREDPDLASVFDDIELPPVSAYTTVESTQDEEMYGTDLQLDFEALGQDLPDIDW